MALDSHPALMTVGSPNVGVSSYDASRWRGAQPVQTHVVADHFGVGAFLQLNPAADMPIDVAVTPHDGIIVLYFRRPLQDLSLTIEDDHYSPTAAGGAFIVMPRGASSRWIGAAANSDENIHVHIDASCLADICLRHGLGHVPAFEGMVAEEDPLIAALSEEIVAVVSRERLPTRLYWDCLITALVLKLASLSGREPGSRRGGLAGWQVRKTTAYLRARFNQNIPLTELAEAVGLSPFHFVRAFKTAIGMPPHRYQVTLRVEEAKRLLLLGTSLSETAECVGYASVQAFSRAFRQYVGAAPGVWRREAARA